MNSLAEFFQNEIGPVNEAISLAIQTLPKSCREAASHILDAGGKRLRPCLVILCARMFGYGQPDIYNLAASMELLHAATLLHDDVLDNAALRRRKTTAHKIFGTVKTILSGDSMLALGNALVASFDKPSLCQCFSHATYATAAGEIQEMELLRKPDLPEAAYLEMIRGKTACLIADSCKMGALAANAGPESENLISEFGENLGMAFQIIDDVLDFLPESETGKPLGGDLLEGKLTYPLRLFRESLPASRQIAFDRQFSSGEFSETEFASLVGRIRPHAEAARKYALAYLEKAKACLQKLPACKERALLFAILNQASERTR